MQPPPDEFLCALFVISALFQSCFHFAHFINPAALLPSSRFPPTLLQLCTCLASTGSFRRASRTAPLKTAERRETRPPTPSWSPQTTVSFRPNQPIRTAELSAGVSEGTRLLIITSLRRTVKGVHKTLSLMCLGVVVSWQRIVFSRCIIQVILSRNGCG